MTAAPDREVPVKAVVCGTTFGQVYLEAFRSPDLPVQLAGILAQGSERSRACARRYGVPLYRNTDELPADIRIACIVVRGGLLGGRGTELAQRLMARGIHVLQEFPVHHDELADCLRGARRNRVVYRLNSFYPHLAPVRRFLAATRRLFALQPPRYVDAACGFQVGYAMLDIIGIALGQVRPWAFSHGTFPDQAAQRRAGFHSLDGVFAGVPLTLRLQNQLDPVDPDNYLHLLHRITFGTDGGDLMLVTPHGPVLWTARPQIPRQVRDPVAEPLYSAYGFGTTEPTTAFLGPANAPSHRAIYGSVWPEGVRHAVRQLHSAIMVNEDPLHVGQYHLALCRMWQDITTRLGRPELSPGTALQPLTAGDLMTVAAAYDAAEGDI